MLDSLISYCPRNKTETWTDIPTTAYLSPGSRSSSCSCRRFSRSLRSRSGLLPVPGNERYLRLNPSVSNLRIMVWSKSCVSEIKITRYLSWSLVPDETDLIELLLGRRLLKWRRSRSILTGFIVYATASTTTRGGGEGGLDLNLIHGFRIPMT